MDRSSMYSGSWVEDWVEDRRSNRFWMKDRSGFWMDRSSMYPPSKCPSHCSHLLFLFLNSFFSLKNIYIAYSPWLYAMPTNKLYTVSAFWIANFHAMESLGAYVRSKPNCSYFV